MYPERGRTEKNEYALKALMLKIISLLILKAFLYAELALRRTVLIFLII